MPALVRERQRVDVVDASSVCPGSTPLTTWIVSRRLSRSAIRPRNSTSTASTGVPGASAAAIRPRLAQSPTNGPERLEVFGGDRRDVDRGRHRTAGERGDDLLGGLVAGAVGRLRGGRAEVRGDDDVRVAEQRVVGDRLGAEHVQRGAGDLARVERGLEVLVDDERAAGDVEHPHAVLHLRERGGVEEALGLLLLRQVDGDEVGHGVDLVGVSARSTPSSRKRSSAR